jgi:hypothetical protein
MNWDVSFRRSGAQAVREPTKVPTRGREAAPALCRAQTETGMEGDNRTRCRIRLGGDELATVLSFHQNISPCGY